MQDEAPLIADVGTFLARFPLPSDLAGQLAIAGKRRFLREFVAVRDRIESDFYAQVDKQCSPRERSLKFLRTLVDPLLGKKIGDAEQFDQTYGRLMRWAWLSISIGIYDDAIKQVGDQAARYRCSTRRRSGPRAASSRTTTPTRAGTLTAAICTSRRCARPASASPATSITHPAWCRRCARPDRSWRGTAISCGKNSAASWRFCGRWCRDSTY